MDIYTNPPKNSYVTGFTKGFIMPTDSGGIPAVVVSKRSASLVVSAYTILILFIFMVGWNLILAVIMSFWPTLRDKNRHIALVALWNSGESMNAATLMFEFCKRMIFADPEPNGKNDPEGGNSAAASGGGARSDGAAAGGDRDPSSGHPDSISKSKQPSNEKQGTEHQPESTPPSRSSNLWWGILFFLLAATMSVGNIAAGILVAGELLMGNVAPPAKEEIFYPDYNLYTAAGDNGAGLSKLTSLRAPAALRAIGAIEASDVTVRDRVSLDTIPAPDGQSSSDWMGLSYAYNVTGVDMGLQSDPKLVLRVKGSCHTDSSWLVKNSTGERDEYKLWGEGDPVFVKRQPDADVPPMVNFYLKKQSVGSNISYAMIVQTAGRYSFSSGQDPWYATEKTRTKVPIAYQIRPGRPALSCWETKRWHLGTSEAETDQLSSLPGLKLYKLWAEEVFPFEFLMPRVVTLGRAAGSSALKSTSFAAAPSYVLDAGLSSIRTDLERLVLASWVNSRNVLRDTTAYKGDGMVNLAQRGKGAVEDGAAKFVLQSGDVGTLSVRILISVPLILLFLYFVDVCLGWVLKHKNLGQPSVFDDNVKNSISLLATQLYRRLDEQLNPPGNWSHKLAAIPAIYRSTDMYGDTPP
ncbi:hypothetical protein C7212DRAFT_357791 [Tuber magnatum]|uniref:Uncharacterized protein n=1 Tax=Tuber magnatum TaxID=42249 RepID=A0A317SRD5_9PEZI|nr:hypothetical protein C7212DRAFT_357791 [Tuber magnatum]